MRIALKIDVDTYRGTRKGVPHLVEMLQRYNAQATFFFSLGPDRMGRAIGNMLRIGKTSHIPIMECYGIGTLLYGTLLPSPDIGLECAAIMRGVRDAGFETGIHAYDHAAWWKDAAVMDAEWTRRELERAVERYTSIFGEAPRAHAAAGWQTNRHALRLTQRMGFDYSSDTRGTQPFIPTWKAEIVACPQLPTTLPTLDELMARDGVTADNIVEHMLKLTAEVPVDGHVFTLRAELEGMKYLPVFEQLLQGWQAAGCELVSLRQYLQALDVGILPRREVVMREIGGRPGRLAIANEGAA